MGCRPDLRGGVEERNAQSENRHRGRAAEASNGTSWTEIAQATGGFGDANNYGSYAMTVYNGALYLGTFNWSTGTKVWMTSNGTSWTQVSYLLY
jgi:hypothetical protein